MQWKITDGQNQTKKLLNMKLRHVGITVTKQQLEFHYVIDIIIYSIKFSDFNLHVSYISRVLNFAIFSKLRNLELARLSENKVVKMPWFTCVYLWPDSSDPSHLGTFCKMFS